jgi:hypothetical protein
MKKILIILSFLPVLLAGCQESVKQKPVEVYIEDGNQFPAFLVGRWIAQGKSGWEFVFEPNGTISSAVLALGQFKVVPGRTAKIPMKMGKKSIIEPGIWTVDYSAKEKRLCVAIVLKHFHVEIGNGILSGSSTYIFDGIVYPDEKRWVAVWTEFRQATTRIPRKPDFDMSTPDLVYGESQELDFRKVGK